MDRVIEILKNNPILLILLGGWLLSMLGNVLTRAARKPPAGRPTPRPGEPEPAPRRMPQEATPEEVADEIRRMMGLDRPKRPPRPEPPPKPVEVVVVEEVEKHGGNLAAELARKEAERRVRTRSRIGDSADALGAAMRERYAERDAQSGQGVRRRRTALFDAADPVRAIVALEVLGAPRALRPWEGR